MIVHSGWAGECWHATALRVRKHLLPASGRVQTCTRGLEEGDDGADVKLKVANTKDALAVSTSSFDRREERREERLSPTPVVLTLVREQVESRCKRLSRNP